MAFATSGSTPFCLPPSPLLMSPLGLDYTRTTTARPQTPEERRQQLLQVINSALAIVHEIDLLDSSDHETNVDAAARRQNGLWSCGSAFGGRPSQHRKHDGGPREEPPEQ
jgi:hypothetical protein